MHAIAAAARQAWPPFALVAGLLMIGAVAAADGLFEAVGATLARLPLGGRGLLVSLLALVAVVTAVLNLDTSAAFLTPVLVHAARRRRVDERPFLYGAVFMSNAASLLLPGSNLTNLLVLQQAPEDGLRFAARMLPAWLVACTITTVFLALAFRPDGARPEAEAPPSVRPTLGAAAALTAAVLVLLLPNPALPVLGVGLAVTLLRRSRPRVDARALILLFALAVALGTLARLDAGVARAAGAHGAWATAALAAGAAVLLNNLPAAALLSAQPPAHPHALLLGLDLGPNLAASGSLSNLLWLRAARAADARPSIATYTRLGLLLAPASLAATLAVAGAPAAPDVPGTSAPASPPAAAAPHAPRTSAACRACCGATAPDRCDGDAPRRRGGDAGQRLIRVRGARVAAPRPSQTTDRRSRMTSCSRSAQPAPDLGCDPVGAR